MTNAEAIEILRPFRNAMIDQHGCPISDAVYALDVALEKWCDVLGRQIPDNGTLMNWCPLVEIPTQQRNGKWELADGYHCSQCNYKLQTTDIPMYCPNCGVRMVSEDEC